MFPLNLHYPYIEVMKAIRETGAIVIAKSATSERRVGNFQMGNPFTWKYIQRFGEDGLLNAYGLTNPGVGACARRIAAACREGYRVVPSFYPFAHNQKSTIANTLDAVATYHHHLRSYFIALELNLSCPNTGSNISSYMGDALACVKAIKLMHPHLCLIGKISVVHPLEFARKLVDAGVNVIHGVNSIPFNLIRPNGPPSPLASVGGGGVSGGPAFNRAYKYNSALHHHLRTAPIIMGCGVTDVADVETYNELHPLGVSICSMVKLNPAKAAKMIRRFAA